MYVFTSCIFLTSVISSILVTVRVGDVTYEYRKNMGDHNRIIKEKCDVQVSYSILRTTIAVVVE